MSPEHQAEADAISAEMDEMMLAALDNSVVPRPDRARFEALQKRVDLLPPSSPLSRSLARLGIYLGFVALDHD